MIAEEKSIKPKVKKETKKVDSKNEEIIAKGKEKAMDDELDFEIEEINIDDDLL